MNKVKQIVAEANFSNRAFPVGTDYASWETDEIIEVEFWRNMGISLLCVFLTTLILIRNLPACILVFICVRSSKTFLVTSKQTDIETLTLLHLIS